MMYICVQYIHIYILYMYVYMNSTAAASRWPLCGPAAATRRPLGGPWAARGGRAAAQKLV